MTTTTSVTGDYTLDMSHSTIGFTARHAMVTKVRGRFADVTGSGHFDVDDPAQSRVEVVIQAKSIDTGNADRDNHLRSNDFLAMDEFPEIRFTSTSVERAGDDRYAVRGDLTIKGVTKPVAIDFEHTGAATDPFGNQRIGFEGSTTINRKDWGVNWNAPLEAGGVLVGEKVTLEFDISAVKTA
ncbi:MAG TPA: YceI family protein [Acidimicrobiales bacterium]|jgi:polyisoprenoid-binding protein YceI|nr:YceI family protein [Acidimicrobiales bacterium]